MREPVRKDITKNEAACRQLETAIRLFFEGADAISVHVLASSAQVIVRHVCRHMGKKSTGDDLESRICTEFIQV